MSARLCPAVLPPAACQSSTRGGLQTLGPKCRVLLALLPPAQVAQAGLLAQRDSLSPFRVVLATSLFSLLGDWLLIGRCGMGVAGAAWTTILAQASEPGGGSGASCAS